MVPLEEHSFLSKFPKKYNFNSLAKNNWSMSIISFLVSVTASNVVSLFPIFREWTPSGLLRRVSLSAVLLPENEREKQAFRRTRPTSVDFLVYTDAEAHGTTMPKRIKRSSRHQHWLIRCLDTEAARSQPLQRKPFFAFWHFTKSISLTHNSSFYQHIAAAFVWTNKQLVLAGQK